MTARKRILVVEDDAGIRQGVVDALEFEGYSPIEAADGDEGLRKALTVDVDLILLDLVLPGRGGLEILREVRQTLATLPVIILTARGEEQDRVAGLRLGADDYVVKPFSVKELLARVAAVLRRSPERPDIEVSVDLPGATIDMDQRSVRFEDGVVHELSEREGALLRYLAMNGGRVISRDEILSRVWRIEPGAVETRTIDVHVARLREKLRDGTFGERRLLTVRGKGYLLSTGTAASEEAAT